MANRLARSHDRVKHADHGVRLPSVAGREGRSLRSVASSEVERDAKEPLAGPRHDDCLLTRRKQEEGFSPPGRHSLAAVGQSGDEGKPK